MNPEKTIDQILDEQRIVSYRDAFKKAMKAYGDQLRKPEGGWIPVSERLPEDSDNLILCFCADDTHKYRILKMINGQWMLAANGRIAAPSKVVTHWKPIEPPTTNP